MVDIADIPDFEGAPGSPLPGQRPPVGDAPAVAPIDVVLVSCPLDRDYVNVALNSATVDDYIAAEISAGRAYPTTVERWSPWSTLQVQLAMADAVKYNYARFTVGGRSWYAFLDPEYLNLTDTAYRVTPDVWSTYNPSIGYSTIVRGHVAVAASQNDTYGDQYLTAPEPIDAPPTTGLLGANVGGSESDSWTVVVISTNDLRGEVFALHINADLIANAADLASAATVDSDGVVQTTIPNARYPWSTKNMDDEPVVYVPKVWPSPASSIDGVSAGGGVYLFTMAGWAEYVTIMQGAPWVLSGITDIRLVPSWSVPAGGGSSYTPTIPSTDPTSGVWAVATSIPVFVGKLTTTTTTGTVLSGWRDTVLGTYGAGIFRKLITSQFTRIGIGGGAGFAEYLPEQWRASGIGYQLVSGGTHGDMGVRLIPNGYNQLGEQMGVDIALGGSGGRAMSGFGIGAANPASTDMTPYLAARSSASSHSAALANKGLAQSLEYTQVQLNAGVQGVQTVMGAASGAGVAGAIGGNPVAGAAAGALSAIPALATAQMSASNAITMIDASQNGSFDIVAVQLGLSGLASVDAFDAWWQSLSSVSGSGAAERLSAAWRGIIGQAFKVVIQVPAVDRIRALISEWSKYGYMIGRAFVPPRLDPMTHWSYWQTRDTTVLGAIPQDARSAVAGAFERGVTVWTSVSEIGTQPANAPRSGIMY